MVHGWNYIVTHLDLIRPDLHEIAFCWRKRKRVLLHYKDCLKGFILIEQLDVVGMPS